MSESHGSKYALQQKRARHQVRTALHAIVLLTTLAGCQQAEEEVMSPRDSQPGAVAYPLSAIAQKAKRYLDEASYEAAEQLFWQEFPRNPSDAGLCCQYVRHLILSRDPATAGLTQTSMKSDTEFYWSVPGLAAEAADLASQLDPRCRTYLADLILESVAVRVRENLDMNRGCVGEAQMLYYPTLDRHRLVPGTELSVINIGWRAIALDATRAQRWAGRYQSLADQSVRIGKVATAMMLGNLTGDLRQRGQGVEDFRHANRAFLAALDNYDPDPQYDWAQEAADAYPDCFRDEMLGLNPGRDIDPLFPALEKRLAGFGVAIPRPTRETIMDRLIPAGAAPESK